MSQSQLYAQGAVKRTQDYLTELQNATSERIEHHLANQQHPVALMFGDTVSRALWGKSQAEILKDATNKVFNAGKNQVSRIANSDTLRAVREGIRDATGFDIADPATEGIQHPEGFYGDNTEELLQEAALSTPELYTAPSTRGRAAPETAEATEMQSFTEPEAQTEQASIEETSFSEPATEDLGESLAETSFNGSVFGDATAEEGLSGLAELGELIAL